MLWHVLDNVAMGTVGAVGCALVGCATFVSGVGDGATAHAPISAEASPLSVADRQFLSAVGSGVDGLEPMTAIGLAERVCGAFREQRSADRVIAVLVGKGLALPQANEIMRASVSAYCPVEGAHLTR